MKKMMLWLCLMMIVPTLASADMVSISELRQQVEAIGHWTQTYEAHGRTIEVDVPIIVPEVEAMPIVTVEAYNAVENDALNRKEYPLKRENSDGWSIEYEESGLFSYLNNAESTVGTISIPDRAAQNEHVYLGGQYHFPQDKRTDKMKYQSVFFAPGEFDSETTYAEDNPNSLQQAMDCCEKVIAYFYPEEKDVFLDAVEVRSRDHKVKNMEDYKLGEYVNSSLMGTYELVIRQRMRGVPIYISVRRVADSEAFTGKEGIISAEWKKMTKMDALDNAFFEYQDDGSFWFVFSWLKEQNVAVENVPLQSFDVILSSIEEKIAAGNIRNVYVLKLGYCMYLNDEANESYTLYPVWICECDYLDSAKEEFRQSWIWDRENSLYVNRYRNQYAYRPLLINAQTGMMEDVRLTRNEQVYCPKIITWEDTQ